MRRWLFASRMLRGLALVLLAALAGGPGSGCYGRFQLTRYVYEVNGKIESKLLRSLVTWAFLLIPVYFGASLLDFVIFNLIEYWTGENLLAPASPRPGEPDRARPARIAIWQHGRERALLVMPEGGAAAPRTATLTIFRDGRLLATLHLRPEEQGRMSAVLERPGEPALHSRAGLGRNGGVKLESGTGEGEEVALPGGLPATSRWEPEVAAPAPRALRAAHRRAPARWLRQRRVAGGTDGGRAGARRLNLAAAVPGGGGARAVVSLSAAARRRES